MQSLMLRLMCVDCQACDGACATDLDENYDLNEHDEHNDHDEHDDDNVDSSLCGRRRGEYVGNLGIHTCLSITFTFLNFASDFHFLSACPSLSHSFILPLTFTFFEHVHHFHFL